MATPVLTVLEEDRHAWFTGRTRAIQKYLDLEMGAAPAGSSRLVLDVGSGAGNMAHHLAHYGHVIGLDYNARPLAVASQRALAACQGFGDAVPFADDSFDLVALLDTVEHIPNELGVLAECGRVLKPGGTLYVGIESRFGFSFWRGAEDHRGTRFTSLLPRRLASWVTRRRGLGDYRTYTHSYHGLRQMLRAAGFQDARFYEPYPTYRMAGRMVPIDDARVLRRSVAAAGISRKHAWALIAASWLGIHRDFVDTYGVVAHK